MATYSQKRLEEKILKGISMLIVQREIKNSKISTLISPASVTLSNDNSYATVFISSFSDDETLAKSIEGLNESHAFIQSRLAKFLKTKNTPVLKFVKDNAINEQEKIEKLLESIKDEKH